MGAVAAIILLFICLISSRNKYVYMAIIAIAYLIGIVLFIMGCATGFGYAIGGGIFIILIAYFLTYVISAGEISIFTLFDSLRGTWEFYPASKKAVAVREANLEEIKKHSKERAGNKSIPTRDALQKFHGWDIPKTPEEFKDKVYESYGRTRCSYGEGAELCKKYAEVLMYDYSSEFYDTTVHYKKEKDWYIILAQIGKQEYEVRKKGWKDKWSMQNI